MVTDLALKRASGGNRLSSLEHIAEVMIIQMIINAFKSV